MPKSAVDLKQMMAAGVHFGHFKRRWHPRMAPYIHSVRGGRCIINLVLTKKALDKALEAVTSLAADNKTILFVGTKCQVKDMIEKAAQSVRMPYVNHRWIGGLLTNYMTINKQIEKLKKLEGQLISGELASKYNKKEVQRHRKAIDDFNQSYGGIKNMGLRPDMIFITDMRTNAIAVAEANKLEIPIVAIADTNVDPSLATYPIPANDDALQSLQMIIDLVIQAIKTGQTQIKTSPAPPPAAPNRATKRS